MSETPSFEAVIFDNDGTLVDSESITLSVIMDMAVEHGADVRPGDAERFVGSHLQVVFTEIASRAGKPVPHDFIDTFRTRQTERIEQGLEEIPGATAVLEHLTALGIPFGVASNAPQAKMALCLKATGLDRFFPVAHRTSAYDIESWKPLPDIFIQAAKTLSVPIERCAIVEDSDTGIEAGLAAQATVFAIDPRGRYESHPDVISLSALADFKTFL